MNGEKIASQYQIRRKLHQPVSKTIFLLALHPANHIMKVEQVAQAVGCEREDLRVWAPKP